VSRPRTTTRPSCGRQARASTRRCCDTHTAATGLTTRCCTTHTPPPLLDPQRQPAASRSHHHPPLMPSLITQPTAVLHPAPHNRLRSPLALALAAAAPSSAGGRCCCVRLAAR
jgi:hypothetical protein